MCQLLHRQEETYFMEFKKGYLKKKLYMEVFQRRYFNTSDCIHVTSKEELKAKNLGLNAPIGLISNGVDIDEFKKYAKQRKA